MLPDVAAFESARVTADSDPWCGLGDWYTLVGGVASGRLRPIWVDSRY